MLTLWVSLLLATLLQAPVSGGVTVRGRVTPADSPALSGTGRVTLVGTTVGTTIPSVDTAVGADGSFEFQKVAPGTYRLRASPGVLSQTANIVVMDKNILDVELVDPKPVEVKGTVVVENGGLRPSLSVSLSPYSGGSNGSAIVSPTGAFGTYLTEGEYRISWNGLPEGYTVRSIVSGSVDLLSKSLTVAGPTMPPITVTLGVSSPPPWVKVSGRVVGIRSTGATPSVSLSGVGMLAPEAHVNPDGTFEFPMVLPGTYTAQIVPPPGNPPRVTVVVGRKDVEGVQIVIPVMKCVPGRVVVEGDGPIPNLSFRLTPADQVSTLSVMPPDHGRFGILLPEGERRITFNAQLLPPGYTLKSFTYGSTDLSRDPLNIVTADSSQLLLTFAAAPGSWAKVSGRITGIDPKARTYQVSIPGLRPLQANVQPDGSFSFEKVLRGNYTMSLTSLGGIPASKPIAVTGQDITGMEFVAPPQKEVTGHVTVEGGAQRFTSFTLVVRGSSAGSVGIYVSAGPDGNFKVALPEGESQVTVSGIPPNAVRSLTYGVVDLLKAPLRVTRADAAELQVTLTAGTVGGVLGGILDSGPSSCTPN
jgi:hypothetical protein